jgi:hypothetical protein
MLLSRGFGLHGESGLNDINSSYATFSKWLKEGIHSPKILFKPGG